VKLICIVGSGRSGSTLLDMLLGGHSQALSLGQVDVLRKWIDLDDLCTCGKKLADCAIWGRVLPTLQDQNGRRIPQPLNIARPSAKIAAAIKWLVSGAGPASPDAALWAELLDKLSEVSGKPILVDSSKTVLRLARLWPQIGSNMMVLHLVRDPRGFVSSNVKPRYMTSPSGVKTISRVLGFPTAVANWTVNNALLHLIGRTRLKDRYRVAIYDDLVADPEKHLTDICDWLGIEFEPAMLPPIDAREFHLIGGNQSRFGGFQALRLDDRWKAELSRTRQRLTQYSAGWLFKLMRNYATRSYSQTARSFPP
jgi:hypothetical protein